MDTKWEVSPWSKKMKQKTSFRMNHTDPQSNAGEKFPHGPSTSNNVSVHCLY